MQRPNDPARELIDDLTDDLLMVLVTIGAIVLSYKLRMAQLDKRERPNDEAA